MRAHDATIALLLAGLAAGCIPTVGPDDLGDFGDVDLCPNVARLVVQPREVALRLGDTLHLRGLSIDPSGAPNILCPAPVWSVASGDAVTVTPDGVVTSVGAGSAWVRGTASGKSDSALVTTSTAPVASMVLSPPPADLRVGQVARLTLVARDSAGNELPVRRISWSSADHAVATVTGRGSVVLLGAGSTTIRAVAEGQGASVLVAPTREAPTLRATRLASGSQHACALVGGGEVPSGTAYCWGAGFSGALGAGALTRAPTPVRVATALTFDHVATGLDHTCAGTASGQIYCWGGNSSGQLGDGTVSDRRTPVRVATTVALRGVAAGGGASCALAAGGAAYCWGTWAGHRRSGPTLLDGNRAFVELTAGARFLCGLDADGRVYCWGEFAGRVFATPTLVSGTVSFATIEAGYLALCGASRERALHCWGGNTGYFWDRSVFNQATPLAVPGGEGVDAVSTGGAAVCVVVGGGTKCLGDLGGFAAASSSLAEVPRGAEHAFDRLAVGDRHACAIDVVGGIWCWGDNGDGQVGIGPDLFTGRPLQLRIQ